MLTDLEILNQIKNGNILIEPFNPSQLNPNSYNVRLHPELMVYDDPILDAHKEPKLSKLVIPEEGLVIYPNRLYLGRTVEYTETHNLVPMLNGRSSIGRLGIMIHLTAGFGDIGFAGTWTLEIATVKPVRIYPNMLIGQLYYEEPTGRVGRVYNGRYQGQIDATGSRFYRGEIDGTDIRFYKGEFV